MNKNILIFAIILVVALPIISAQFNFKQNIESDLKVPCYFNGSFCSSSAVCNITITAPSGLLLINDTLMTNQLTFHNITLNISQTDEIGDYISFMSCLDQNFAEKSTFEFRVTPFGKDLSTSQGIIYLGVLLIAFSIFGVAMYWAVVIPWSDTRNLEGEIIDLNNLRYVKLLLWFLAYLILIWITFLLKAVTENFLFIDVAAKIFNVMFWWLTAFLFPIFTLTVIFAVILFIRNLKLAKLISEGIFPE